MGVSKQSFLFVFANNKNHKKQKKKQKQPGQERQVLDYGTQSQRLLPLISAAYAMNSVGRYMQDLAAHSAKSVEQGDLSVLAELHATSAGLKSLCTRIACDGIEECRR